MSKPNDDQGLDLIESQYVTTAEVAKHFRVAVATVINMVHSGEIPRDCYARFGSGQRRVYRFQLNKLEAHMLTADLDAAANNDPKSGATPETGDME